VDQQLNGTPGGRAETPAVQEEGQRSPQQRSPEMPRYHTEAAKGDGGCPFSS